MLHIWHLQLHLEVTAIMAVLLEPFRNLLTMVLALTKHYPLIINQT
jgi:hypothetical protein